MCQNVSAYKSHSPDISEHAGFVQTVAKSTARKAKNTSPTTIMTHAVSQNIGNRTLHIVSLYKVGESEMSQQVSETIRKQKHNVQSLFS